VAARSVVLDQIVVQIVRQSACGEQRLDSAACSEVERVEAGPPDGQLREGDRRRLDSRHVVERTVRPALEARIGGDVVRQPSFIDSDLAAGVVARYRVTAIDRTVPPNESAPSSVVELRVAADPTAGPGHP
jgi:hypothetical protein